MKNYTLYLAAALIFISCKNSSGFSPTKKDTIFQLMAFKDSLNKPYIDMGYQIHDTQYWIPGIFPVLNPVSGEQMKDSSGKGYIQRRWYPTDAKNIIVNGDFRGFNVDSFIQSKK